MELHILSNKEPAHPQRFDLCDGPKWPQGSKAPDEGVVAKVSELQDSHADDGEVKHVPT